MELQSLLFKMNLVFVAIKYFSTVSSESGFAQFKCQQSHPLLFFFPSAFTLCLWRLALNAHLKGLAISKSAICTFE